MKLVMKSVIRSVLAAGGVAATAVAFSGSATAAPMGPDASQTLMSLQSEGYHVIVNKTGNAPLDQCSVSAVRPGQKYTRMESEIPGPSDNGVGIVTTVLAETVYLDLSC